MMLSGGASPGRFLPAGRPVRPRHGRDLSVPVPGRTVFFRCLNPKTLEVRNELV